MEKKQEENFDIVKFIEKIQTQDFQKIMKTK